MKDVMILTGAGQIGMAIARRMGYGMKIVIGDKRLENAEAVADTMNKAGFDGLEVLQPCNIRDTLHAYQLAKRCNVKRVMAEAVKWGKRGARINSISPGIIVTPLALDEFNGSRGDFYKDMFARCPAGRPGTADEVANVAELLMSKQGAFITGSDFLMDGGATAAYCEDWLWPVFWQGYLSSFHLRR